MKTFPPPHFCALALPRCSWRKLVRIPRADVDAFLLFGQFASRITAFADRSLTHEHRRRVLCTHIQRGPSHAMRSRQIRQIPMRGLAGRRSGIPVQCAGIRRNELRLLVSDEIRQGLTCVWHGGIEGRVMQEEGNRITRRTVPCFPLRPHCQERHLSRQGGLRRRLPFSDSTWHGAQARPPFPMFR